jgi:hypothetical protein
MGHTHCLDDFKSPVPGRVCIHPVQSQNMKRKFDAVLQVASEEEVVHAEAVENGKANRDRGTISEPSQKQESSENAECDGLSCLVFNRAGIFESSLVSFARHRALRGRRSHAFHPTALVCGIGFVLTFRSESSGSWEDLE